MADQEQELKHLSKRWILHLKPESNGILAVRAIKSLERDGYKQCVYGYEGENIFVRRNKNSITAYEEISDGKEEQDT